MTRVPNCVLVVLLAAGCTSINANSATFEGTSWQVTAINGHPAPATASYRVQFRKGQLSGQLGCNRFGATYDARGDVLTVGPLAATRMACGPPAGTFENWAFLVLRQPMRMRWSSDRQLTLSNPTGSLVLERSP